MWVVGGHMMARHMNKDVYLHVAKFQPFPFHVQDNCTYKIVIVIIYYVGDMWQHTIRQKKLSI
jgi:hypothetical protein